jgi:ERCC4-type nuclease
MTLIVNKQESETLRGLLPLDVVIDSAIGTDSIIQGLEKNRMYERKELKDFMASIQDGRIFEQLKELSNNKEEYEPFLIIEGFGFYYWTAKRWVNLRQYFDLHPDRELAFYSVLTAIKAFNVGLVWTTDKKGTATFLIHENEKLGKAKEKKEYPERRGFKKDWDNEKKKLYLLEAFGPATAKALIKEYKTVGRIGQEADFVGIANVKLASGRRIGASKALEIFEVIVK